MYYLQSRYYDASVGRFIKSDISEMMLLQVEKASGTNLFAYCNNDAIGGSDPHEIGSGHSYRSCILAYAPYDSQFTEQSRKTLICIIKKAHF